ncbi:hypothetical protein AAC387_Pa05g0324 [Persea americana]
MKLLLFSIGTKAMGSASSKRKTKPFESNYTPHLIENLRFLQEEIIEVNCKRERESRAHKRLVSAFAAKQAEWKRERKRWKDEVRRLRRRLEEKEEIVSQLEEDAMIAVEGDKEWQIERANYLVEHLRVEQAHREEAVEKWKQLYLAIKTELDDLIHRTRQGERLWWEAEDDVMERLQRELKAKDETVEALRAQISAMEDMGAKREREVDILRQSLRILSNPIRRGNVSK